MAFVGPRPLPMVYGEAQSGSQRSRLDVLPGLTGWAQVNWRNAIDWDDRLALDVWYVAHRSLLLDLKILKDPAKTLTFTTVHTLLANPVAQSLLAQTQ